MSRLILFLVIWLGSCFYALIRGGAPERIGAGILLLAALMSAAAQSGQSHFQSIEFGLLMVDLAVFAGFLGLALLSKRFWPLWMSAAQAIVVLSHLAIALNPAVIAWGYWNAETLWSYPMLILLAIATYRHQTRLTRMGADPAWRRFSRP